MSDKVIMLCVVLVAVAVIAIVFIRRAMRYGKIPGTSATNGESRSETRQGPTTEEESDLATERRVSTIIDDFMSRYFKDSRNTECESDLEPQDEPDNDNG